MPVFFRALGATVGPVLARPWPWRWRCGLVLAVYAVCLPLSGYDRLPFDAGEYWGLAATFFKPGLHFSLLNYAEPLRGYLGPLLLVPGRVLCYAAGWPAEAGARVLGLCWAALLFGVAGPAAWAAATGRALRGGAWLLAVGLGVVFWRDYFNFPLQDVPALALLLLALAALARPGGRWAALGGLLLAAALNLRPVYLASVPGAVGWLWWRTRGAAAGPFIAWGALVAGAALVLVPQAAINYVHFGRPSPLVLATGGGRPLYLKQLNWGTAYQRYESSLDPAHFGSVAFADSAGARQLRAEPGGAFGSYGQFAGFAARHPLAVGLRCARHLFNGLDLWYPTPYPRRLHPAGRPALQLLNYAVLALGLAALLGRAGRARRGPPAPAHGAGWALLALGLPVALALPTLVECRFLLPLHLLLLTAAADGCRPRRWRALPRRWQAAALLLLAVALWGGWQLSAATAGQLVAGDPPVY